MPNLVAGLQTTVNVQRLLPVIRCVFEKHFPDTVHPTQEHMTRRAPEARMDFHSNVHLLFASNGQCLVSVPGTGYVHVDLGRIPSAGTRELTSKALPFLSGVFREIRGTFRSVRLEIPEFGPDAVFSPSCYYHFLEMINAIGACSHLDLDGCKLADLQDGFAECAGKTSRRLSSLSLADNGLGTLDPEHLGMGLSRLPPRLEALDVSANGINLATSFPEFVQALPSGLKRLRVVENPVSNTAIEALIPVIPQTRLTAVDVTPDGLDPRLLQALDDVLHENLLRSRCGTLFGGSRICEAPESESSLALDTRTP